MYKIFINDRPFIISKTDLPDEKYKLCERLVWSDSVIIMDLVRQTEELKSKGVIIITNEPEEVFEKFCSNFIRIEASGGIVFNEDGKLLWIKRLGKWDLPKGKIDSGETAEEAAKREVEEECGVKKLASVGFFATSYHTYKIQGHRFLKVNYWYIFNCNDSSKPVPQIEESITEAEWSTLTHSSRKIDETYLSIQDLLGELLKTEKYSS